MIYVKNNILPMVLNSAGYKIDSDFQIKVEDNSWDFRPNLEKRKLAITSERKNKTILIGTPYFKYDDKFESITKSVNSLERRLKNLNPDFIDNFYSFLGGNVVGAVAGGHGNAGIIGFGIFTTATVILATRRANLATFKDTVKDNYRGRVGSEAFKFLEL